MVRGGVGRQNQVGTTKKPRHFVNSSRHVTIRFVSHSDLGKAFSLKAHSYRRAFFPNFPQFGNNWRYLSIYGGVLSLFVKISRSKNFKFVNIPIFGKKTGKYGRLKNCAKKMSKNWEKSSPIRMTLILGYSRDYTK